MNTQRMVKGLLDFGIRRLWTTNIAPIFLKWARERNSAISTNSGQTDSIHAQVSFAHIVRLTSIRERLKVIGSYIQQCTRLK